MAANKVLSEVVGRLPKGLEKIVLERKKGSVRAIRRLVGV